MEFKIVYSSGKEVIPANVERFQVQQNNRSKWVALATYDHPQLGNRTIAFLDGVESYLNKNNRYVCTHSNKEHAAKLVEIIEEETPIEPK